MAKDAKTQEPQQGGTATMEPPVRSQPNPKMLPKKFKLVDGQHSGFDRNAQQRLWQQGSIVECYKARYIPAVKDDRGLVITPERYEIYEAFDLAKRYNAPNSIKFRAVSVDTPSDKGLLLVDGNPTMDEAETAEFERQESLAMQRAQKRADGNEDAFDPMTDAQLRQYAEEVEIDVSDVRSRDAMLHLLRQNENLAHPLNQ